ncbi:MAG: hypothetical protein V1736_05415 [Pseudomonadota bacterium]
MGSKEKLVFLDTNVFVIDLRYKRDVNYGNNASFLTYIGQTRRGYTTVVNLLELCGILSFNLNEKQLLQMWFYFQDRYQISVLPVPSLETDFPILSLKEIFDLIKMKTSLGDALVVSVGQKYLPFAKTMVTWDKEHFDGKFSGDVLTPTEFMHLVKS